MAASALRSTPSVARCDQWEVPGVVEKRAVGPSIQSCLNPQFWYSKREALVLVAALSLLSLFFGSLTPPFQSPDEFNHIKRAYLLSTGEFLATSRANDIGGEIDEGLLSYMECFKDFPFNYSAKIMGSLVRACDKIHYTQQTKFSDFPNTAMYFPILYAPQALALFLGERNGLSVSSSYYLARLLSLGAALTLLVLALMIFPVPPAVLALFFMPMCLFQLGSASLDALSFSTTVLIASLFMRGYDRELSFKPHMHLLLAVCLVLLSTSKIVYVVLAPLLLFIYRARRSRMYILSFIAVLCASLSWLMYAGKLFAKSQVSWGTAPGEAIAYYSTDIVAFFSVMFRTITDGELLRGYWQMFVGVLGWLDTPIGSAAYIVFTIQLVVIIIVSGPLTRASALNGGNLVLGCAAAVTLLLLFVAFLIWTPHPAITIQGIQGRYLYPVAILLLFSVCGTSSSRMSKLMTVTILFLMAVSSVGYVVPRLLDRYWVSETAKISAHTLGSAHGARVT